MGVADLKKGTEFLRGGGETGALMRARDWSTSILGQPETWPHSLTIAVQIILNSRYPMFVWWGPQLINFYNDSYVPFLGHRHPRALGIPAQESWREIWDVVGPQADQVMKEGRPTWNEEKLLVMERYGYREETYFTWSYSPLLDDQGGIGGVFCAVTEDTTRVLGQRRIKVLRALGAQTASARTVEQACEIAATTMAGNVNDLPFGMIYLLDAEKQARLAGSFGLEEHSQFRPATIHLNGDGSWPLDHVAQSGEMEIVTGIERMFGEIKNQPWPEAISTAVIQPFARQGASTPAGFLVAGISPRLQLDDDYRGFFGLLASQVAAAIANADAYQEERRRAEGLAEIDRAKTTFFSNVSHEFRTPLTLMLGPLEDALANHDERMPAADLDRLAMVHRNGLRLLKLVNTLLDFSRIEAGRVLATYQPTDLSQLTAQLASVFRSAMERAGLRFEVKCPPLTQSVFVDRDMWEKIVLNLIANAFKFTFAGEVHVRLQETDGRAILSVSDTGTGIPGEELPRVFERFHRVEGASGRTHEGTGIGLALVQELVRLHGGSVKVESALGQGSTFIVTIPMGSTHLPQERVRSRPNEESAAPLFESYIEEAPGWTLSTSGHRETPIIPAAELATVLLADDNADMREYVSKLLSKQYRVIPVANGHEALSAVRMEHPDLVLTDVMMPELDGFGLLRELRKDAKLRNIPVIMLSARAGEEARVEGLEAGADDYMVKPFTARELAARIGTHISMSRLRRRTVEMEKSLRSEAERERERLRAALNASNTATFYWDVAAAEVIEYDPEALPLFGFLPQQAKLAAADFIARVHVEDRSAVATAIEDARQGKDVDFEFRVVHPDGSLHWIHNRGKVVWKDGHAAYLVGAVTDVTERKLAHEALIQNEKLASVGRLAATVAHEINNPLESITNLIYLAKSDPGLPQNVVNYLRMADEELGRVAQLTKQTLGFYRESTGWSSFPIAAMLSQLLQVFSSKTTNKCIRIDLAVESNVEIVAVPGEMRQLFANLLNNSIDAVGEGGQIHIKVSASRLGADGDPAVRVSVADSGPGIDPSLQKKIFEPFFTTKKAVGTGLGLWICKTIVEKHHGVLQIRSSTRPGRSWTVLSVLLPAGPGTPVTADTVALKTAV